MPIRGLINELTNIPDGVYTLPAGSVDEAAVHQDDVLRRRGHACHSDLPLHRRTVASPYRISTGVVRMPDPWYAWP